MKPDMVGWTLEISSLHEEGTQRVDFLRDLN